MKKRSTLYRRLGKPAFDVLASALLVIVLSPALIVLAISVRVFLGTPVIFRQTRSGRQQQPFTIFKFRTMTNACDAYGNLLPDSERLTPFGRFLRGSSMDELPGLFNVLLGTMSLVGPRPLLPRYDAYYTERESQRFELLPGITGWAQINGRNDLTWNDRLAWDARYADECSLGLDLKILFLTAIKVLRRDNVQVDPGLTFGFLDVERQQHAKSQDLPAQWKYRTEGALAGVRGFSEGRSAFERLQADQLAIQTMSAIDPQPNVAEFPLRQKE